LIDLSFELVTYCGRICKTYEVKFEMLVFVWYMKLEMYIVTLAVIYFECANWAILAFQQVIYP
jgi:hypothetical protein